MISPQDIQAVKFKTKVRGYNEAEVDEYLDQIAEQLSALIAENEEYKSKLALAVEQLNYLKGLEQTLRDTMITAQRSSDETYRAAQKKGEALVQQAEEQGEAIRKKAREEADAVTRNLDMLRVQAKTYARQFRTLMNAQLKLLEENGLAENEGRRSRDRDRARDNRDTGSAPAEKTAEE
jgi:cell division initiation protein